MSLPLSSDETERLKALRLLEILDTDPEKEFDDLTRIAAQICEVPISAISLVDADRQWFKSIVGLEISETTRAAAFCAYTILGEEVFIVPNAGEDERFAANPLVTGDPNIRFYAAAPLITEGGQAVGSLCVIDRVPRDLRPAQKEMLQALARQAMRMLELRKDSIALKRVNEELQAREGSYRIISESASDAIITIDEDSSIVFANAAVEKTFGYSTEQMIGKNLSLIVPERLRAAHSAGMRRYMQTSRKNIPWNGITLPALRRDGEEIQIEISFGEYHQNGKRFFTAVIRDITDRERIEAKLRESEKRYRFLTESVPQQVWTASPDGRLNYGNSRVVEYFGKNSPQELFAMSWAKIIHPDDLQETAAAWNRAVKTGEYYEQEHRLRRSDGEYRWYLAQAVPMVSDGEIVKWLGTNTDIHDRKLAEEVTRQSLEYRNLFQNANDAILIFEPETENVIDVNEKACQMYAIEREKFLGKSIKEMSQDVKRGTTQLKTLIKKGTHQSFETVQYRADGTPINLLINSSVIEYQGKKVVLSINRDVSEQKKAQRALQESREQYQQLFDSNPHPVWVYDTETLEFLAFNNEMARRYGYSRALLRKMTIKDIRPPEDVPLMLEQVKEAISNQNISAHAARHRTKDGTIIDVEVVSRPINFAGRAARLVLATDVTTRKRAENRLLYNATHDALTGLANRARFMDHLQLNIQQRKSERRNLSAVLFLDLDRFKIVNDSLGHSEGDDLLKQIARRLEAATRTGDLVARLGGDEFVILLSDLIEENDVVVVAERIQKNLKDAFDLKGNEAFISASIGIAFNTEAYQKAEEMVRDADIAMYRAKANGKSRHQIFDLSMRQYAASKLQLENELRRAIETKEFFLHYQPIIDLRTGKITGFVSLVRWQHSARGFVPPLEFISVAEETGLIVPLGLWILRESCLQLRRWQTLAPANADLTMSVNLSPKQFMQNDLAESIIKIVNETETDPARLRLEITESHIMEDSETAIAIMNRLRALGIKLSIDDFGTGYSSLSYLHRLPINYLKIDRSFVSQIEDKPENREIVRTIVLLAKNLNLNVIAEGIETIEQAHYLKNLGCGFGQGYLYSKPVAARQADALIEQNFSTDVTPSEGKNLIRAPSSGEQTRC